MTYGSYSLLPDGPSQPASIKPNLKWDYKRSTCVRLVLIHIHSETHFGSANAKRDFPQERSINAGLPLKRECISLDCGLLFALTKSLLPTSDKMYVCFMICILSLDRTMRNKNHGEQKNLHSSVYTQTNPLFVSSQAPGLFLGIYRSIYPRIWHCAFMRHNKGWVPVQKIQVQVQFRSKGSGPGPDLNLDLMQYDSYQWSISLQRNLFGGVLDLHCHFKILQR